MLAWTDIVSGNVYSVIYVDKTAFFRCSETEEKPILVHPILI